MNMQANIDDLILNEEKEESVSDEGVIETTPEDIPLASEQQQTEDKEKQASDEFEIPEKFKNKTLEDVVKSYVELEKEFGRKNQEIGELRKLADEIIKKQLAQPAPVQQQQQQAQQPEIDPDDILIDPLNAVQKIVETNPRLQQLEQELRSTKAEVGQKRLLEKHPDMFETVQSAEFQSWVMSSPVRREMFQRADAEYDYEVADELLTWYKSTKQAEKEAATDIRKKVAEETVKKAATEGKPSTENNKPIFSRAELIRLRIENPRRFEELEPQILEAYAEGRVR